MNIKLVRQCMPHLNLWKFTPTHIYMHKKEKYVEEDVVIICFRKKLTGEEEEN